MEYKIVELLKEIKSMIQGKKSEDGWMDIKKTSDYTALPPQTGPVLELVL